MLAEETPKQEVHNLTYKEHQPAQGPNKGKVLYFVECSCNSGSPYGESIWALDGWIVAHLVGAGQIRLDEGISRATV
jgi:hypothetical protein